MLHHSVLKFCDAVGKDEMQTEWAKVNRNTRRELAEISKLVSQTAKRKGRANSGRGLFEGKI
jgi:hypothetical protein